jgi:hypothetical protein
MWNGGLISEHNHGNFEELREPLPEVPLVNNWHLLQAGIHQRQWWHAWATAYESRERPDD